MIGGGTSDVSAGLEIKKQIRYAPSDFVSLELLNPVTDKLGDYIIANAKGSPAMVQPDTNRAQTLALCGAGPSLRSLRFDKTDRVWACNSALPYLIGEGVRVDVGISIDQTPAMLREWLEPPDVMYYVASSCDPALIAHLHDHKREVRLFHNNVGVYPDDEKPNPEWEWRQYCDLYQPGYMVGEGATVVSRSIGLGFWAGFERVDIYGADCCFADDDLAHANGDTENEAYGGHSTIMEGEISGRQWRTRPDMLLEAVDLVRRVRTTDGKIRLIGDTLPVALLGKSEEFLDQVMRRLVPGETPPTGARD